MDELAKLMDELALAIKARCEASIQTEYLASEVRTLPKLSVITPKDVGESKEGEDLLHKLQLQLELQNLTYLQEQAQECLDHALTAISKIRWAVGALHSKSQTDIETRIKIHDEKIQAEVARHAEAQYQKQVVLFEIMQTVAKLSKHVKSV